MELLDHTESVKLFLRRPLAEPLFLVFLHPLRQNQSPIQEARMKSYAIALSLLLTAGAVIGQTGKEGVDTHVAAAKAAARQEHTSFLNLCSVPEPPAAATQGQRA